MLTSGGGLRAKELIGGKNALLLPPDSTWEGHFCEGVLQRYLAASLLCRATLTFDRLCATDYVINLDSLR